MTPIFQRTSHHLSCRQNSCWFAYSLPSCYEPLQTGTADPLPRRALLTAHTQLCTAANTPKHPLGWEAEKSSIYTPVTARTLKAITLRREGGGIHASEKEDVREIRSKNLDKSPSQNTPKAEAVSHEETAC